MTTQKVGVVSCGMGTQHLAMPKDLNTLCGRRIEYDLPNGKFDPQLDCQQCRKSAEKQLLIATPTNNQLDNIRSVLLIKLEK